MLRMCVSTVFWLRNSAAAISGLVLRSTMSARDLELALGQRRDPDARPRLPGRVRRWMRRPSLRSSRSASAR